MTLFHRVPDPKQWLMGGSYQSRVYPTMLPKIREHDEDGPPSSSSFSIELKEVTESIIYRQTAGTCQRGTIQQIVNVASSGDWKFPAIDNNNQPSPAIERNSLPRRSAINSTETKIRDRTYDGSIVYRVDFSLILYI